MSSSQNSSRRRFAARRRQKDTGSPNFSEPDFILVAKFRRPHGLRGEVQVSLETDFPERIQVGGRLYLGEQHQPLTITSRRVHADGLLLTFEEFPDLDSLAGVRNQPLFVEAANLPELGVGEYYHHQLMGMQVSDEEGQDLGQLVDILETGANDVYVVRSPEGKEILLPAIKDVILDIDVTARQMRVHVLPGLL